MINTLNIRNFKSNLIETNIILYEIDVSDKKELLNIINNFIKQNNIIIDDILYVKKNIMIIKNNSSLPPLFDYEINKKIKYSIFNSLFDLNNEFILYNTETNNIYISNITEYNSVFINKILKKICYNIIKYYNDDKIIMIDFLKMYKRMYIDTLNLEFFKDIIINKYVYTDENGDELLSDNIIENDKYILNRYNNYISYILPIIQSFI